MRYFVVRALLLKEARRHAANRGGIALCLLLVVAALAVSVLEPGTARPDADAGSVGLQNCLVECSTGDEFAADLRSHLPGELAGRVQFRRVSPDDVTGLVSYPPGTAAFRVRLSAEAVEVGVWHPPGDPQALAVHERWFWPALRQALQLEAVRRIEAGGGDGSQLTRPAVGPGSPPASWAVEDSVRQLAREVAQLAPGTESPRLVVSQHGLGGRPMDLRTTVTTGMVIFALYFFCVYLLPAMTCEERERGSLLAQALSPASTAEILAAKFLFYPVLGAAMATAVVLITKPGVASTLFYWLTLVAVGGAFLGIGMTVATLARTQRAALMGSMCYLMAVALGLLVAQGIGAAWLSYLAVEFHGPRALFAAISGDVQHHHWANLVGAATLGTLWLGLAGLLFRRRGWQ